MQGLETLNLSRMVISILPSRERCPVRQGLETYRAPHRQAAVYCVGSDAPLGRGWKLSPQP